VSLPGRIATALLDALYPPRCVPCGATGALRCAPCRATIQAPQPPLCERCDASLHDPHGRITTLPTVDDERLREVCSGGGGPALLADTLRALSWQPDLILPVPLHRDRVRQRGYNQAELLARRCARGLPLRRDLLRWRRATRPQVGLSAADRRSIVADAFTLASSRAAALVESRRILLIDDVATTSSTLNACAAALLLAHPTAIWGQTVTRTELAADNADAHLRIAARSGGAQRNGPTASDRRTP
jgi:predicted amidophosphoribosyltransferase